MNPRISWENFLSFLGNFFKEKTLGFALFQLMLIIVTFGFFAWALFKADAVARVRHYTDRGFRPFDSYSKKWLIDSKINLSIEDNISISRQGSLDGSLKEKL